MASLSADLLGLVGLQHRGHLLHALHAGYGMLVKFGFRNGKAFIQKRCTLDLAACQHSFNIASGSVGVKSAPACRVLR